MRGPRRVRQAWAAAGGGRRASRAALTLLMGTALVVESAARGRGALGPWSGFVGLIALVALVAGLVEASTRVVVTATGLLGAAAVIGGNARLSGLGGAVEDALVAACLLLVAESGVWANEARTVRGQPAVTREARDFRRLAFVLLTALGGGTLGGLAIAAAATTREATSGILPVIAAAAAGCLVMLLAFSLAADDPATRRRR
jgi:hypothetical protein